MSATVTLTCDAERIGKPCGIFLPVLAASAVLARRHSRTEGWSQPVVAGRVLDCCPACTRATS